MAGGRPSALRPSAFFRTLKARVPELFELADIELTLTLGIHGPGQLIVVIAP